jgi:GTP 3',8-cyclase
MSTTIKTAYKLLNLYRDITPNSAKFYLRENFRRAQYHLRPAARRLHPIAIEIETNNICNRSCSYCPREPNDTSVLPEAQFKAVIDELADWGYQGRLSPHAYNEPLSDTRLPQLLRYASDKLPNSRIVVFSNGDLLTDDAYHQLRQAGVNAFKLSIHEGSSEDQADTLQQLQARHERIALSDFRPTRRNEPLLSRGGLIAISNQNYRKHCFDVEVAVIRVNGDVVLCNNDAQKRHVMGNVIERISDGSKTPFQDIWLDESFVALRQNIHAGEFELPICQNCSYKC